MVLTLYMVSAIVSDLPCEYIWIMCTRECLLQLLQLETGESSAITTLFPLWWILVHAAIVAVLIR